MCNKVFKNHLGLEAPNSQVFLKINMPPINIKDPVQELINHAQNQKLLEPLQPNYVWRKTRNRNTPPSSNLRDDTRSQRAPKKQVTSRLQVQIANGTQNKRHIYTLAIQKNSSRKTIKSQMPNQNINFNRNNMDPPRRITRH